VEFRDSLLYGENPPTPWRYPSRHGDGEATRGMVVSVWSGREARALRIGLRMTIEAFAEHLGVAVRTVAKWEAQGPKIVPTPGIQEVLDAALERATPAQQSRFQMLLEESSAPEERANPVNRREFINDVLAVVALGMLHPDRLAAALGAPVAVDTAAPGGPGGHGP